MIMSGDSDSHPTNKVEGGLTLQYKSMAVLTSNYPVPLPSTPTTTPLLQQLLLYS